MESKAPGKIVSAVGVIGLVLVSLFMYKFAKTTVHNIIGSVVVWISVSIMIAGISSFMTGFKTSTLLLLMFVTGYYGGPYALHILSLMN